MKKSDKLFDIIGQIDDRLIEEAAKAGFTENEKAETFEAVSRRRKKKKANVYRWQGALAACAVLAVCVGLVGLLQRSGMLLSPFEAKSRPEEAVPMEVQKAAQDTALEEKMEAAPEAVAMDAGEPVAAAEEMQPEAEPVEKAAEEAEMGAEAAAEPGDGAVPDAEAADIETATGAAEENEVSIMALEEAGTEGNLTAEQTEDGAAGKTGTRSFSGQSDTQEAKDAAGSERIVTTVLSGSSRDITYSIENGSDKEISYGEECSLERLVDGSWTPVELKAEICREDILHMLEAGESQEESLKLEIAYGELENGSYRLVKKYQIDGEDGSHQMYIVFTVEN